MRKEEFCDFVLNNSFIVIHEAVSSITTLWVVFQVFKLGFSLSSSIKGSLSSSIKGSLCNKKLDYPS